MGGRLTPLQVARKAVSIPDGASMLGVSKTILWRLRREGKVKFIKIAGRTVITLAEINRILEEGVEK